MTLIKSISGIRGTIGCAAGDNLTPPDIVRFASGYAAWLRERHPSGKLLVVVGRDARISGEMVCNVIVGTLLACGIDVSDTGLCTTPGVEMAVKARGAQGGIIITASHNPREWNALKLLNEEGEFLNAAEGNRVLALADTGNMLYAGVDDMGRVVDRTPFTAEHIAAVLALELVDTTKIRERKFRVVVDAVNSVGGIAIPELLVELGAEVICINCTPDGNFAHNPEPLPENLTELSERVVAEKADLGISIDPDVDRLALVCEDGLMFGEEYTLVAAADYVLSRTPGNTVSNLSSTRALRDVTQKYGGEYAAAAVGEVNVVEVMKRTGAVIGGEGNGGVIYPALHYGRDALAGVALILSHLARTGLTARQLRETYPRYHMSKRKMNLPEGADAKRLLEKMAARYAGEKINTVDGLKIDFAQGWVHMRLSNTEPIIRIYSEAQFRGTADALAEKMIIEFEELTDR